MRVMDGYRGRRTCFPSAVDFNFGYRIVYFLTIVDVFRGDAEFRGGRTCFPTAFEYMHVVTSEYLYNFTAPVNDVRMHFHLVSFFNSQVAWSGVRIVSFTCSDFSAELERSRWLVAFLRPFKDWLSFVFRIPQTSDFTYAVHALRVVFFFALLNGEGWYTVGLVVPRCSFLIHNCF